MIPLSTRMRPERLEEFAGQTHFLYKGSLLYNSIKNKTFDSAVFFGPSGTGKTTLARIVAKEMDAGFVEINASTTGTKELKELIEKAKKTKTVEELSALAKENGIDLTGEEAKSCFARLHPENGALSDEELGNVAGGGCSANDGYLDMKKPL